MSKAFLYAEISDVSTAKGLAAANGNVMPAGTIAVDVQAITQNIRYRGDGGTPTASVGILLRTTDGPTRLQGGLSNYKFIEVTSSAKLGVSFIGHKLITVDSGSLSGGTHDVAYSDTVTTTGHVGSRTFTKTAGTLPTGLTLNATTGVLSGTPTSAATYTFTITVTDQAGNTGSANFSVVIA